ncbi:MAG: Nif11-like leader peptide family natural product precursor [Propionibacteriaceae bacterium]|jgi:predicted ribosomally synthesized peptide with nif11-like leader|nr:Nif11-like leader peptide family natural product precursor [Propionibacteriaceae bacterium]
MSSVKAFFRELESNPDLRGQVQECDGPDWLDQIIAVAAEAGYDLDRDDLADHIDDLPDGVLPVDGNIDDYGRHDVEQADAMYA